VASESDSHKTVSQVRAVRARLHVDGPPQSRPLEGDFERVSLPASDGDVLRDTLIAAEVRVVIEVGLAYGASALAIGEALCLTAGAGTRHVIIDPYQASAFANVGWDLVQDAGLGATTTLMTEPSSLALARLQSEGFQADAAFVDGSHRFHEVFIDLYYLRKLVRPEGLIILDDGSWPSVATAIRYFDLNLGWEKVELPGRLTARRLPREPFEPDFSDFVPF
jgi:predicted O-methyltransferase YrrM